jgi:hypothetical protein
MVQSQEIPLDWLDRVFLFVVDSYLYALPINMAQNPKPEDFKNFFNKHPINSRSFCLVKIENKQKPVQ